MTQPSWTDVLTAISAAGIGLIGLYFAFRQEVMSRLKWKHELYDRRMAIYVAAGQSIGFMFRNGKLTDEDLFEFLQATRESDFLLNEKITERLQEMYRRAVHLQTLDFELEDLPVGDERTAKVHEREDIKVWYIDQADELKELFTPFLKLST